MYILFTLLYARFVGSQDVLYNVFINYSFTIYTVVNVGSALSDLPYFTDTIFFAPRKLPTNVIMHRWAAAVVRGDRGEETHTRRSNDL